MTMLELEALFVLCGLLCGLTMSASLSTVEIPVAASMYNTMAGAAAASIGVLLQLPALMVVGSLVAGAGVALARLLAQSMNRSVGHVLLQEAGKVARSGLHTEAADAAIFMRYARKVVIVPGYGLAVAQAQQKLHELIRLLQAAGVDVKLALHPMAGRRPEQMAQLLAEVGVPEDLILWSGETDEHFRSADVALIIGANDVVNPTTSTIKSLPVFGVPCLNAALSGRIYLIKRGAGSGYAGIANASFASDHCKLVLGDAQIVLTKMVDSLRILQVPAAA
jgi:NAD(P) transhydrogenase subunit beta